MTTRLRISKLDSAPHWVDVTEIDNGNVVNVTTLKTRGDEIEVTIWATKSVSIVEREPPEDANA